MRTKFQKQTQHNASRGINLQPQAEEVGQLTPVHIQDIVKDRNLDYLEILGQLVERSKANPVWYQYESNQNKLKFLQVYQLSINYARNTQSIYGNILNELDEQFGKRKQKVEKLKSQILAHKQKTTKLKKQYRRDRLNKQKDRALSYEKSLKQLRDNMVKQKSKLKENNQKLRWENQERRQKEAERQRELQKQKRMTAQKFGMNMHPSLPPYPMYPPYPYYAPPPGHQSQPYFHPYQSPASPQYPNQHQNNQTLQLAQRNQKLLQHIMKEASSKTDSKQQQKRKSVDNFNEISSPTNALILQTESVIQRPSFKSDAGKQKNGSAINKIPELKQSGKQPAQKQIKQSGSLAHKNSDKSWTLRNSDHVRESVADSEKNDLIDNLSKNPPTSKITKQKNQMSKVSRKQSDMISGADMDSLIDVQLRPESQNNLSDQFGKKTNKLQHKVSILEKHSDIPVVNVIKKQQQHDDDQDRYSLTKRDNKNPLKIKFDQSGVLESSVESQKHFGYLQQSNQGKKYTGKQSNNSSDKDYLNVKGLKVKPTDRIGVSVVDSMLDTSSRNQSKNQLQDYQDDFQDAPDEAIAGKTRVKVNVQSSESSPEKPRLPDFFPLFRNYFILKQEAKAEKKLSQSKYSSGLGSLKQYSVKFVGSEKKKVAYDRSQQGVSDLEGNDMLEFIDMPMDSIIAKPSKLKQSTIKKSAIQNKIHKSHDPKSKAPGEFILNTPVVSGTKADKKDDLDDNFAKIKGETLQSRIIAGANDNKLKVPLPQKKPDQKLAMDMIESQIIEQENGSKEQQDLDGNQSSIELSIIPQTQNESLHTQKSSKHKILLLIDRKYRQKGAVQFDKNIIKNEIQSLVKNKKEQYGWQQLTNVFNQLAKKKQDEVNALIQQRKRKVKSKQGQSKKDSQSQAPSRQNSNKITKNSQKIQKSKDPFKQKPSQMTENDDLSYSRSYLQNPVSQTQKNPLKLPQQGPSTKSTKPDSLKPQFQSEPRLQELKKEVSSPTSANSPATINNKFLRDQDNNKNSAVSNNRMLNKVIQSSKFDKDDQIENTIKANFGNAKLHSVAEQLDQSF